MSEILSSVKMGGQRFWQWWMLELADAYSRVRKPASIPARSENIISAGENGIFAGDIGYDVLDALPNGKISPVRLRLPASAYFLRRIEIPAAARSDIKRILDLDLERTTPFVPGDICSAHYIDDTRRRPGFLSVCQVIVQRDRLSVALAGAEARGLAISHIDCWKPDGKGVLPVDLLPAITGDAATPKPASTVLAVLFAVTCMLAASCVYIVLERHENALEQLHREVSSARERVQHGRAKAGAMEDARRQADTLQRLAQDRINVVRVIDDLTKALPDTAWLTELRIDGDGLHMAGFAKPAAALVASLEQASNFTDATLTAPVVRDGTFDRERFSLRLRIGKTAAPNDNERRSEEGSQ